MAAASLASAPGGRAVASLDVEAQHGETRRSSVSHSRRVSHTAEGPRRASDDELIKQPQRESPAGWAVLAVGRGVYVLGAFAAFHAQRDAGLSALQFLTAIFTVSAVLLGALHRPWRPTVKGRRVGVPELLLCWKLAACTAAAHWLLVFGLAACAPVRFLVLEHLEVPLTYCIGTISGRKRVQDEKVQGGLLIFAGYVVCLWHDTTPVQEGRGAVDATNTYDSFVGACAIGLASLLAVGTRRAERQLCAQMGSLKRVHALQMILALTILWPLAILEVVLIKKEAAPIERSMPAVQFYPLLLFSAVAFCTLRFALLSIQQHFRVPEGEALRTSAIVVTVLALGIHTSHSWDNLVVPVAVASARLPKAARRAIVNRGAAAFGNATAVIASPVAEGAYRLADSESAADASSALAVYLAAGLVCGGVLRFTASEGGGRRALPAVDVEHAEGLALPAHADVSPAVRLLGRLWHEPSTRRPLGYLAVSLAFASTELLYGHLASAPGLVSDAALVLLDCLAASIALAAAHASTQRPSGSCAYGGSRAEELGGFVNGLLLILAAWGVVAGAARRALLAPGDHTWSSERLLIVHVVGLAINVLGLVLFFDGPPQAGRRPSQNTRGLFLHVLADCLGSVVIVASSLARHYYGWVALDPLASLLVAAALVALAAPLLRATALVLLQAQPQDLDAPKVLARIQRLGGALGCRRVHFWRVAASAETQGSLCLVVPESLSQDRRQALQSEVTEVLTAVDVALCLQIERVPSSA